MHALRPGPEAMPKCVASAVRMCNGSAGNMHLSRAAQVGGGRSSSLAPLRKSSAFGAASCVACLVRKNFQDFSLHQIFGRMYRALNINKNKN